MDTVIKAFGLVFQFDVMIAVVASAFYGLTVGALPGLSATMATALLVPVPTWRNWLALLPPALLAFYALVSETLGFLPTTAIMVLICSLAFGARPKLAVPLAIIAPFAINLIFLKLLRVPLPGGILPFPW